MLKAKRQDLMMQQLDKHGILNVAELSAFFQCTEETIRRDLKELEINGCLLRTHGGAMKNLESRNVPFTMRETLFINEKNAMAHKATSLLQKDMLIMLDASSTCYQFAKVLTTKCLSLFILTNSLEICNLFADVESDYKIHCTGGDFNSLKASFNGTFALRDISSFYADIAFISCSKLDIEYGLSDDSLEEAQIRETMLKHAKLKVLIVDHTKFHGIANHIFYPLKDIDMVITDKPLEDIWNKYFIDNHIDVIYI